MNTTNLSGNTALVTPLTSDLDVNALKAAMLSLNLRGISATQLIDAVKREQMNLSISSGFHTNAGRCEHLLFV